jgi:hypothetical protein
VILNQMKALLNNKIRRWAYSLQLERMRLFMIISTLDNISAAQAQIKKQEMMTHLSILNESLQKWDMILTIEVFNFRKQDWDNFKWEG